MEDREGVFGVLNLDALDGAPLTLLDGGVERRAGEAYDYYNGNRTEYGGFLFQYTLRGEGVFERDGKKYKVTEAEGFSFGFRRRAAIIFRSSRCGSFSICISREARRKLL